MEAAHHLHIWDTCAGDVYRDTGAIVQLAQSQMTRNAAAAGSAAAPKCLGANR